MKGLLPIVQRASKSRIQISYPLSKAGAPQFQAHRSFMTSSIVSRSELVSGSCEPCKKSTPPLEKDQQASLLKQLASGWKLEPFVGSGQLSVLQKSYTFKNFKYALAFANKVGEIAETQKHHPEVLLGWGHVEVAWWTHAIGDLHQNDFICAAKTEEAAESAEGLKSKV